MTRLSAASLRQLLSEGTPRPPDTRCTLFRVGLYGRCRPHLVIWQVDRSLANSTCGSGTQLLHSRCVMHHLPVGTPACFQNSHDDAWSVWAKADPVLHGGSVKAHLPVDGRSWGHQVLWHVDRLLQRLIGKIVCYTARQPWQRVQLGVGQHCGAHAGADHFRLAALILGGNEEGPALRVQLGKGCSPLGNVFQHGCLLARVANVAARHLAELGSQAVLHSLQLGITWAQGLLIDGLGLQHRQTKSECPQSPVGTGRNPQKQAPAAVAWPLKSHSRPEAAVQQTAQQIQIADYTRYSMKGGLHCSMALCGHRCPCQWVLAKAGRTSTDPPPQGAQCTAGQLTLTMSLH